MSATPREELRAAVAAEAAGTPYQVVDTPDGFDLRIDLADARWWGPLGTAGRRKVVQHRVVLDEERRRLTLTDDHYDVSWHAAAGTGERVPRLEATARVERTVGRSHEVTLERVWGADPATGRPATVVDIAFSSREGQDLVRRAAARLGWTERAGAAQRLGLVAGAVGAGVALVVITALVAVWLTGGM